MKKTYNINISGQSFLIYEDAYAMLYTYLTTLDELCSRVGEKETADDIELRITEIFSEHYAMCPAYIISLEEVEEVITRMGAPEEIVGVEPESAGAGEEVEVEVHADCTPPPLYPQPVQKRLHRDPDNKVLGGVCSGLAWYMKVDTVWVRLIAVLITLLSGSTLVLVYIVLWIVVPLAVTPYQKMQMMA